MAVEAIEGTGMITLTTRNRPDCVELCFADTGRGMPPEVKRGIFEPFFTTQDAGLDLSIPYDIIQKHGGTITGESNSRSFWRGRRTGKIPGAGSFHREEAPGTNARPGVVRK